jgi:hypothetical protein
MERRQRLTLLGVAAAIAVVAIVIALVASGGDDNGNSDATNAQKTTTATTPSGDTTTETTPSAPAGTTANIQIKGGQAQGGVQKIKVGKNDPLQITVNSDQELPIHFHGYDIEKPTAPGKPAVFKLDKANIEGVFEMEIESTKTKIASITVNP